MLSVSLLSIVGSKCTVELAVSGNGRLRVLAISRLILLGDKNPDSRCPAKSFRVRKSFIKYLIQV